jgi:hypothetical protein
MSDILLVKMTMNKSREEDSRIRFGFGPFCVTQGSWIIAPKVNMVAVSLPHELQLITVNRRTQSDNSRADTR